MKEILDYQPGTGRPRVLFGWLYFCSIAAFWAYVGFSALTFLPELNWKRLSHPGMLAAGTVAALLFCTCAIYRNLEPNQTRANQCARRLAVLVALFTIGALIEGHRGPLHGPGYMKVVQRARLQSIWLRIRISDDYISRNQFPARLEDVFKERLDELEQLKSDTGPIEYLVAGQNVQPGARIAVMRAGPIGEKNWKTIIDSNGNMVTVP